MIIKFLRSSASPPVINLKMCQEDSLESYESVSTLNETTNSQSFDHLMIDTKYGISKKNFRIMGKSIVDKRNKKNAYDKSRSSKGKNMSYKKAMTPHIGNIYHHVNTVREVFQPVETTRRWFTLCLRFFSGYSFFSRFISALFLEVVPAFVFRLVLSNEVLDIYRNRYYFERIMISRYFGAEVLENCRNNIVATYQLLTPNYSNIDVWSCYVISVRESTSFIQFTAITYNSLRALGFQLLSPYINSLFLNMLMEILRFKLKLGFLVNLFLCSTHLSALIKCCRNHQHVNLFCVCSQCSFLLLAVNLRLCSFLSVVLSYFETAF